MAAKKTPKAKKNQLAQNGLPAAQPTVPTEINSDIIVPETEIGGEDGLEPGAWAKHIKEFAWPNEPSSSLSNGRVQTCVVLRMLTSKREPHVRRLCGQDVHVKIDSRVENLESALAQVSGDRPERACEQCNMGCGPWVSCVVAEGEFGGACANCHWMSNGGFCSFGEFISKFTIVVIIF